MNTDFDKLQDMLRHEDWASAFSMLDEARRTAATPEDHKREVFWRSIALAGQKRQDEAIDLLRENTQSFNSQSHVKHEIARLLVSQGRDYEALGELNSAPIEFELNEFYALAIDAKFLHFYLLAKEDDQTIANRLSEIPDDYRYISHDGRILCKPDIIAFLSRSASATPRPS